MNLANDDAHYTITPEDIKLAYDKGAYYGSNCKIDNRTDYYDNVCFKANTYLHYVSNNPYTVTGNGKKLKSAWHNGFISTVNRVV
jgi:hypothetical protein